MYPQLTQQVGSRRYISPEVARSEAYNLKSDVYSFGFILWEILSLHPEPDSEYEGMQNAESNRHRNDSTYFDGDASLDRAILIEGRLRPTLPRAQWCKELADLVEQCWYHDLQRRPTMKHALATLKTIHADMSSSGAMIPSSNTNQVCSKDKDDTQRKKKNNSDINNNSIVKDIGLYPSVDSTTIKTAAEEDATSTIEATSAVLSTD